MKLASIEQIISIDKHPNADRLEIAQVLGWQAVVPKGVFTPGELVVFVYIDTVLPRTSWSEFLVDKLNPDKPIRLKTARIRGQFSRGLVLSISVLPANDYEIGDDVGELLGITKYEKELSLSLGGEALGSFPTYFVAKTDEDNGLSDPLLMQEVLANRVCVTRKLDGSSCTVIVNGGIIEQCCSRNLSLKESDSNAFWTAAKKLNLDGIPDCILQCELMGPGVQGNQLKLKSSTLFVFSVFENSIPLDYETMCSRLVAMKANAVPLVGFYDILTVEQCQELADSQKLADGSPAEGIVVRPCPYRLQPSGRVLGFKIINKYYAD